MTRSPRDRPSAAEKKERQVRTGPVDCGMAVPATSADLVNLPQDFSLGSRGAGRRCSVLTFLTSGPLSSSAPDCLSSSLKEYRAPHGAVVLSSQLAIPVEGRAGTSLPVGQLSRAFLLDPMLDQWLHGRKSRKCFLRPFHSAFKAASRLQDDASVFKLVYSGCPRSCLMAHSDRGHPSVRSPGPVVLVCHKAKARGVSAARSSRHPLPLHG